MTCEPYDVVIVGGGWAGAAIAKVIAQSGRKRVLNLEAGRGTGMSADKYAPHVTDFHWMGTCLRMPERGQPLRSAGAFPPDTPSRGCRSGQ